MMTPQVGRRVDAPIEVDTNEPSTSTPVCQTTSMSGSELTRLRRAEEGRISPTVSRRTRESSPTASRYFLRSSQSYKSIRTATTKPGVRPAISPMNGRAKQRSRSGNKQSRSGSGGRCVSKARKTERRTKFAADSG